MTRRLAVTVLAAVLALPALAGCGEKKEPAEPSAGGPAQKFRVLLDYFPNADHAGLYAARAEGDYKQTGLDVTLTTPPDPASTLKLLQAGKADLAISYEPELLLAQDKGADLVAVGALVQKPLTSLMAIGDGARDIREVRDLRGKRVGTSGISYQTAYLETILEDAGVDPKSVKETNVGFNLVPAMLTGKVDATLGAFWNYEGTDLARRGRRPRIVRMETAGVPTYNELIFVARRKDLDEDGSAALRRFLQATTRGHERLRQDPDAGVEPLLEANKDLEPGLQRAVVRKTLPVFFPEDEARPFGFMDPREWGAYARWMREKGLLEQEPDATKQPYTNEFLPGESVDPGIAGTN